MGDFKYRIRILEDEIKRLKRENMILEFKLAKKNGCTNVEIANQFEISESTVRRMLGKKSS